MKHFPFDVTFHPSWWHKNAGVDFSQRFFDDPQYRIEADKAMRRCLYEKFGDFGLGEENPQDRPLLGTDYLAAGYLHSELMGCKIIYQSDNSPQVCCMNADIEDLADVKAPNLDESPVWARVQKQIDWLLEHYGRVETYINLMGPQNIALDMLGQEVFVSYYTDEEEITHLLSEITDLSIEVGKRFKALSNDISGGVTAICRQVMPDCYLTSNCSVEMISNELYEKFVLPLDQRLADAFGSFGIHHCGKTMEHVAQGYSKVKGLTFAEVGAGSDLAYVRSVFPTLPLNARYSAVNLKNESKEEIEANVRILYTSGKGEEGHLSISCVGIDSNTPDENVRWFLEACRKYNN